MEVGFNYPWPRNQNYTIGPNTNEGPDKPHPWRAEPSELDRNLRTLRDAGVSVVRLWLLATGHNYDGVVTRRRRPPIGVGSRHVIPAPGGEHVWDFEPPEQLPPVFAEDFEALFGKFRAAGMKMIPSLLDYSFFDEPHNPTLSSFPLDRPTPTGLNYIRGRRSIIDKSSYRTRFVDGTLRPLLDVAKRHRDLVYAFEIVNEPWWSIATVTSIAGYGVPFGRAVNREALSAFLSLCLKTVQEYGLESTVGHRYYADLTTNFPTVKPSRPQFHYYATPWPLSSQDTVPRMPVPIQGAEPFLGEFGAITEAEIDALRKDPANRAKPIQDQIDNLSITGNPWPMPMLQGRDRKPETVLIERLRWLKLVGYKLAVVWPNVIHRDETRDDLKLDALRLAQIKEFTTKG